MDETAHCPRWCDGRHGVDDGDGIYHGRVLSRLGDATVCLSMIQAGPGAEDGPVILFEARPDGEIAVLTPEHAARLLRGLAVTDGDSAWLTAALGEALALVRGV